MAGAGGVWRIRVSGSLVYRKPTVGLWSSKIDVNPAAGDPFTMILDADHQALVLFLEPRQLGLEVFFAHGALRGPSRA